MFAGIDWASEEHAVCVVDATGRVVDRFTITHSADGFERLVRRLAERADPVDLPVAIERPDGRLVDRLREAGHPVVPVKTTAIKAWREAEVASGAKSDPGDARVIAEYLRSRRQQLRELRPFSEETRSVVAHLDEHPDAIVFRSLPRAGQVNAAQMLAEWGDCREAYEDPEAVAALSGMAPVTRRSGKHLAVGFRWACNTRFRNAMATFADNSRHASPWAASIYAAAVARGADHPHAVRILARAWIRVIFRCWTNRVPYDPARHGGAARLETAQSAVLAA